MENPKITDLLGKEIKIGDYVANGISSYGKGKLRRSLVTNISEFTRYKGGPKIIKVNLKGIFIDFIYNWKSRYTSKAAIIGTTSYQIDPERPDSFKLNVLKLGEFEEIFTEDERKLIAEAGIKTRV